MCALDHPKMNTSAQKYIAPQLHMHHCAEGNTKPFTGPKAFAAMKQDEARKAMNHNTPSNKARQPGRHIKQPDTQREGPAQNWARTPQGTNRRGEGKGQGEDNSKTQAEPPTQEHNTEEPQHEGNQREDQRQPEGKESTAPKTNKVRGPGGGQDHKRRAKRPPKTQEQDGANHEMVPKGNWHRRPNQVQKGHAKRRNSKKGGGSRRHTPCSMFEVVLFVCSESVSPAVSCCKEDRIQPLLLCGMEPQSITFGLKGHPVNLRRFFP